MIDYINDSVSNHYFMGLTAWIDVGAGLMVSLLIVSLFIGACLGAVYFVGLWWTVRKLASVTQSGLKIAMLFLGSLIVRTSLVVLGFYFILGNSWQSLVLGLIGFMLVRLLVVRIIYPSSSLTLSLQAISESSTVKSTDKKSVIQPAFKAKKQPYAP
ncbi:MAG: ATP synthase subunit I [Oleibacter sp.]|nr:ATP synthase subunit I [Thalassolituus sp.]